MSLIIRKDCWGYDRSRIVLLFRACVGVIVKGAEATIGETSSNSSIACCILFRNNSLEEKHETISFCRRQLLVK